MLLSDFDIATLNGDQNEYGTEYFASRNYWDDRNRTAMDDLESLLYTMWSISSIPIGGPSGKFPEGKMLAQCMREKSEKAYLKVYNEMVLDTELHTIKFTKFAHSFVGQI